MAKHDKRKLPYWYDAGILPLQLCYVPNKAGWAVFNEQIGLDEPWPMEGRSSGGNCLVLENTKVKDLVCCITFEVAPETTLPQIVGIISHEMVHVMQYTMRSLEKWKKSPQRHDEIEAYIIQWGTQAIFKTYTDIIAK